MTTLSLSSLLASPLRARVLEHNGIEHAFFTREGGVSGGVYASLNGGVGSKDDPEAVTENRRRMETHLGLESGRLLVPYQIHSSEALIVAEPFVERPRCDGLVTAKPALGLGVTGADCGILLFCDPQARVIGACHAGWKGALDGILESTLAAMEKAGARRSAIHAALGPTIGPQSYEVGPEFFGRFQAVTQEHAQFFTASARSGYFMFDLPGFIGWRLGRAGIAAFENLGLDTYADETRFYSYRRSVHRQEADYGRQIAAIALS